MIIRILFILTICLSFNPLAADQRFKDREAEIAKELTELQQQAFELVSRNHRIALKAKDMSFGFLGVTGSMAALISFLSIFWGENVHHMLAAYTGSGSVAAAYLGFGQWFYRDFELTHWDKTWDLGNRELQSYASEAEAQILQAIEEFEVAREIEDSDSRLEQVFHILGKHLKKLSDEPGIHMLDYDYKRLKPAPKFLVLLKRAIYKSAELELTAAAYKASSQSAESMRALNCKAALALVDLHWTKLPEWKFGP